MTDISRSLLPVTSLTVDVSTDDVSNNDVSDNDVSKTLFAVSQASSMSAPRCETCLRISRSTASWADCIWAR